ncbi:MAG TPA: hypothetical protein VF857_00630, partial [Spirochaetota bacterium]
MKRLVITLLVLFSAVMISCGSSEDKKPALTDNPAAKQSVDAAMDGVSAALKTAGVSSSPALVAKSRALRLGEMIRKTVALNGSFTYGSAGAPVYITGTINTSADGTTCTEVLSITFANYQSTYLDDNNTSHDTVLNGLIKFTATITDTSETIAYAGDYTIAIDGVSHSISWDLDFAINYQTLDVAISGTVTV